MNWSDQLRPKLWVKGEESLRVEKENSHVFLMLTSSSGNYGMPSQK